MTDLREQTLPLSKGAVAPVVEPHLGTLAQVFTRAFGTYRQLRQSCGSQIAQASAGARGMLLADFARTPAHALFGGVAGVGVDNRYGRPWVNLAGGTVQIRFRKLTAQLRLCPSDSDRQLALAYHLGDPCLPGMPEATILTAGYVLDDAATQMVGMHLVCHVGPEPHYWFDLPAAAHRQSPGVTQLPLVPLSDPVIRSARQDVRRRLSAETPRP